MACRPAAHSKTTSLALRPSLSARKLHQLSVALSDLWVGDVTRRLGAAHERRNDLSGAYSLNHTLHAVRKAPTRRLNERAHPPPYTERWSVRLIPAFCSFDAHPELGNKLAAEVTRV